MTMWRFIKGCGSKLMSNKIQSSWPWVNSTLGRLCGNTSVHPYPVPVNPKVMIREATNWPEEVASYGLKMRTHYGPFVVLSEGLEGAKRKRTVAPPLVDLEDLLQAVRRSTAMARMLQNAGELLEYTEWASRRLSDDPNACSSKQVAGSLAIAKRHGLSRALHIGASAATGHKWAFDERWISEYASGSFGHGEAPVALPATVLPAPLLALNVPPNVPPTRVKDARKRASLPSAVRMAVWNAYFGREAGVGQCYCCGEQIFQQAFECGHVVAAAKGGSDAVDNLRPVCSICNKSQGDDHMDDFISVYFPREKPASGHAKEISTPRIRIRAKRSVVPPSDPMVT